MMAKKEPMSSDVSPDRPCASGCIYERLSTVYMSSRRGPEETTIGLREDTHTSEITATEPR
jgi:hypothetical protein